MKTKIRLKNAKDVNKSRIFVFINVKIAKMLVFVSNVRMKFIMLEATSFIVSTKSIYRLNSMLIKQYLIGIYNVNSIKIISLNIIAILVIRIYVYNVRKSIDFIEIISLN